MSRSALVGAALIAVGVAIVCLVGLTLAAANGAVDAALAAGGL